jgi:hypothetical protein
MKTKDKTLPTPKEGHYWGVTYSEFGTKSYVEVPLAEEPIELTPKEIARQEKRAKLSNPNLTADEKAELQAHLSPKGHFIFSAVVFICALLLGIIFRGWFGFLIVMVPIGFVLFKVPTSIKMHSDKESIDPDYKNHRLF